MDYSSQTKQAGASIGRAEQSNGLCEAPRTPEVSMQFNHLNNSLDLMEKSLIQLGSRIAPILSANRPCGVKEDSVPSMSADMAKLMQTYNNRLSSLIDMVNDLNARIEL